MDDYTKVCKYIRLIAIETQRGGTKKTAYQTQKDNEIEEIRTTEIHKCKTSGEGIQRHRQTEREKEEPSNCSKENTSFWLSSDKNTRMHHNGKAYRVIDRQKNRGTISLLQNNTSLWLSSSSCLDLTRSGFTSRALKPRHDLHEEASHFSCL